ADDCEMPLQMRIADHRWIRRNMAVMKASGKLTPSRRVVRHRLAKVEMLGRTGSQAPTNRKRALPPSNRSVYPRSSADFTAQLVRNKREPELTSGLYGIDRSPIITEL